LFNPLPDPGFVPLDHRRDPFVPPLAICAVIATFTRRRTGSSLPGALIAAFRHVVRRSGYRHPGCVLDNCPD
jgi:hypothetical protein